MIELKNIYKSFNRGTVNESKLFEDFSLSVETGEFVSVVGSNGSGKTTLLNIICGTSDIDSGKILLDGKDITNIPEYKRAKFIDRVFQNTEYGTCPDMTVFENMSMADNKGRGFGFSFMKNREKKDFYREKLALLGMGLEDRMETKVKYLSGGQRQAIALLMVTLSPIDFLILDEHTAALDPHTAEVIMELTGKIVKEHNMTAIMVTHNLRYATEYGTRLIMMDKGKCVLDVKDDQKKNTSVDDILGLFNSISIECGN